MDLAGMYANIQGADQAGLQISSDIFRIAPPEIEKTHVFMTVFDGKIIYQARP